MAAVTAFDSTPAEGASLVILGSTGSIGTQALRILDEHPGRFTLTGLAAGGGRVDVLAEQAVRYQVRTLAVAGGDEAALVEALDRAASKAGVSTYRPEVLVGPTAATTLAGSGASIVLNGITGSIGLMPTLAALKAGSRLALANKESLIVGGSLVTEAAAPGQIVPVDSEHSAIAQCLRGGRPEEVRRLIITASGGPFRGWDRGRLSAVTPAQALAHPNFAMGKVITTNSATLVNKGLEVIEAHLLFGVPFERIHVVVHPQQQIHSMVEFHDGSTIAQAGPPRMLVPIGLGLSWPERLVDVDEPSDWSQPQQWDFEPLDEHAFPAVPLAYEVGRLGGTYPAVYNAANEECVEAFHAGRIGFLDIVDTVAAVVRAHDPAGVGVTVDVTPSTDDQPALSQRADTGRHQGVARVLAAESWARQAACRILDGLADGSTRDSEGRDLPTLGNKGATLP